MALESSIAPRDFNFAKKQAADKKFAREEKEENFFAFLRRAHKDERRDELLCIVVLAFCAEASIEVATCC